MSYLIKNALILFIASIVAVWGINHVIGYNLDVAGYILIGIFLAFISFGAAWIIQAIRK